MYWCCEGFRAQVENAGQRGFAVFVAPVYGVSAFVLQHRALNEGDPGPLEHCSPISTVSEIQLVFCPWCGRRLDSFYGPDPLDLRRPHLGIARQ